MLNFRNSIAPREIDCHVVPNSRLAKLEGRQKMFALGSFRTLINNSREDSVAQRQLEAKTRLATAALLVRVATVDSDDMSEVRAKELYRILRSRFRLDDLPTTRLIEDACRAERSAIDLYQFTRLLNKGLDDRGRRQVVQMMWEMAYVEGRLNGFEANVIWRTADLLGVSYRQRVEMRQQIAETSALASGQADNTRILRAAPQNWIYLQLSCEAAS
jgi:uncharacterized tellurite resistance protein B-like protein